MDPFKTVGAFSWAELVTPDPVEAKAFYGPLFGWAFNEMDMGGMAYHTVHLGQADAQGIAGLMAPPPGSPPVPPHWGSYVTVADCDQTVEKAGSLGGKCLIGPMDIPGVGRMAVLQDPQGAVINVIAYTEPAA